MSFLQPLVRNAARQSLRRSTNIRQSYLPRSNLLLPLISNSARTFTSAKISSQKDSSSEPPNTNNSANDPSNPPPSSQEPAATNPDTTKDPFNQDIQAAPGSILSQYAVTEQDTSLEPTESASGRTKPEAYISSADRKRDRMAKIFTWGFFAGLVGTGIYLGRPLDEEERERLGWTDVPEGQSPVAYWKRFQKRGKYMLSFYNEPAFQKLLPEPAPEPYGRPYTLLLDLDDFLIHSEWTREHGWRTAKRPGLDYFLGYLGQFYEIVIFSSQYSGLAGPVVAKLDPYHNSLSGALFRESTRYIDGKIVKDLTYINRDLGKVILIDTNPDSYLLQPENAIPVPKWKGDARDKGLVALIPFLEYLATQNFKDFRPILTEYKEAAEKHHVTIAEEFSHREALAREALKKTLKPAPATSTPSFISRLFGLRALPPVQMKPETPDDIVTPLDLLRKQATESYEQMKKYIDEHGEEILEEDKRREQQLLGDQKTSLVGFMARIGGGGQPPPPPAAAAAGQGQGTQEVKK